MRRRNFSLLLALLLGWFCAVNSWAADFAPVGPEAGRELAARLCSMRPSENSTWTGTLHIYPHNGKASSLSISGETIVTETNWSATYNLAATAATPAEKLRIIFSTNVPPEYFYARAAAPDAPPGELKRLPNRAADIPLGGSDFWLSDLGFEFFHWPDQVRQPGQFHNNRPCYVLNCLNPRPGPGGYAKVVLWVDEESGQPIDAEAYGADKKHLKDFSLGEVKRIHDHYEVKALKISNDQTRSRTELEFDLKNQQ